MNLEAQLLSPCAWTVHPLEGVADLAVMAVEAWGLGSITHNCDPWSVARWPRSKIS